MKWEIWGWKRSSGWVLSLLISPDLSKSVSKMASLDALSGPCYSTIQAAYIVSSSSSMTRENRGAQWEAHGEENTYQDGSGWRNREHFWRTKDKCHFARQFSQFCLGLVQEFLSKVYVICKIWLYLSLQKKTKSALIQDSKPSEGHWALSL